MNFKTYFLFVCLATYLMLFLFLEWRKHVNKMNSMTFVMTLFRFYVITNITFIVQHHFISK